MAVMILRAFAAALAALSLSACVTSSSKPVAPVDKQEVAQSNLDLGVTYLRQGDLKSAQFKLEKALAADDSLAPAHAALGVVFERLGDYPAAERHYRRAVSLEPSNPDTLNALAAFLCLQKRDTSEALRLFDKALAVPLSKSSANRAMLNTNAGLCAKRVDLPRAESYLRAALAVDPGYRDALLQLADVSFGRGNHLQARAFLERYLSVSKASPEALWLGVRIENALGERSAARTYAGRLKSEFPESEQARLLIESERNAG